MSVHHAYVHHATATRLCVCARACTRARARHAAAAADVAPLEQQREVTRRRPTQRHRQAAFNIGVTARDKSLISSAAHTRSAAACHGMRALQDWRTLKDRNEPGTSAGWSNICLPSRAGPPSTNTQLHGCLQRHAAGGSVRAAWAPGGRRRAKLWKAAHPRSPANPRADVVNARLQRVTARSTRPAYIIWGPPGTLPPPHPHIRGSLYDAWQGSKLLALLAAQMGDVRCVGVTVAPRTARRGHICPCNLLQFAPTRPV